MRRETVPPGETATRHPAPGGDGPGLRMAPAEVVEDLAPGPLDVEPADLSSRPGSSTPSTWPSRHQIPEVAEPGIGDAVSGPPVRDPSEQCSTHATTAGMWHGTGWPVPAL